MGSFNRESAGQVSAPVSIDVERGALVFFAETIGETNPIHLDAQAAQAAGYCDIVAPPTYPAVLDMAAAHETRRAGRDDILTRIGADLRRLLHGTEAYEYHGPIVAGDRVTVSTRVKGFSVSSTGKLEFAHLETEITHADRGLLVSLQRDLIHRLG